MAPGPRTWDGRLHRNLLIHEIALWAKSRDDTVLHLGGGVGGSADDGLFMFKAGFSPRRHIFCTLRLVADDARYQELVRSRADALGLRPEELLKSPFFPAYRADPACEREDPR